VKASLRLPYRGAYGWRGQRGDDASPADGLARRCNRPDGTRMIQRRPTSRPPTFSCVR
jgi:hypothetical protein